MSAEKLTCPVCAYCFEINGAGACGNCPLHGGCDMVCCPNCGHTTVDIRQSGLVRLVEKMGLWLRKDRRVAADDMAVLPRAADPSIPRPVKAGSLQWPRETDLVGPPGSSSARSEAAANRCISIEGDPGQPAVMDRKDPASVSPGGGSDRERAAFRLSEAKPGVTVRVEALSPDLSPPRCARLQAYGVVPGFEITVIQQAPVTVVLVDHLELAMEGDVAAGVLVAEI